MEKPANCTLSNLRNMAFVPPPQKNVLYRQRLSTASLLSVWESEAERVLHSSAHFQSVNEISEYYPTAHISPTWPWGFQLDPVSRQDFLPEGLTSSCCYGCCPRHKTKCPFLSQWLDNNEQVDFFSPFFIFFISAASLLWKSFFLIHLFNWCISAHKILQRDFSFLILQSVSITARPCAADTSNNHRWKPDPPCLYLAQ